MLLGGEPLASLSVAALRTELLVEPHTVDLFGRSLAEAVDSGAWRTPEQRSAALAAAAVGALGDDLDRPLQDHGMNLSGGQRQRIALARALLADRRCWSCATPPPPSTPSPRTPSPPASATSATLNPSPAEPPTNPAEPPTNPADALLGAPTHALHDVRDGTEECVSEVDEGERRAVHGADHHQPAAARIL